MFRFREWRIYNEARALRLDIHKNLLCKIPDKEKYNLVSQITRATDSIILNIVEGSYRKSDKDFAHFLNQSLASLYEVVGCLDLLLDSCYINLVEHEKYNKKLEESAKQISAFSKRLKS